MKVSVDQQVASVRAFNRFYTNVIGLVHGMYLDMPYSLTEARLLFEIARRDVTAAADLRQLLDIDPGYLSRVLSRFEADGLITRARADGDARRQEIRLTGSGRAAAAELDTRSAKQIGALLEKVDRERLLSAMRDISALLGDKVGGPDRGYARTVVLRAPRPGDLGWIVYRHGTVYAEEFGWNEDFEQWVAKIIADYAELRASQPDSKRSAAWIAEVDGSTAGCVLCVPDDSATRRRHGCGSCWWNNGRAGSASAGASWMRCCDSPARPDTRGSCCLPTTRSSARGAFTRLRDSRLSIRSTSACSGKNSTHKNGRWIFKQSAPSFTRSVTLKSR